VKNGKNYLTSTLVAIGLISAFNALPANAADSGLAAEVVTSTFEENGEECASVTINGEEVISYRGEVDGDSAEDRAESLADKLEEILDEEKDSIESLLPARDGNQAAIKRNGKTVLKFALPVINADSDEQGKLAVKTSLQIINALRLAAGTTKLPDSINNFADAAAAGRLANIQGDDSFSGRASWYGPNFHGRKTSNGERYDQEGMTAAHRTLPFGTKLLVTNRSTGKSCVVKVNDRGPYVDNRVIDLSKGAAKQLNMVSSGVAMVDVFVLQ
jgi:rare lipoprotein A